MCEIFRGCYLYNLNPLEVIRLVSLLQLVSSIILKSGDPSTFQSKLNEPGVIEIINHNKIAVEPFSDLVDEAFVRFRTELAPNMDPYAQQENDEVEE